MAARPQDSARFHALHRDFLILPNAWDAMSARLIAEAGAAAIATSSSAVAWARGYADGHQLPPALLADTVASIARVVSVPISADAEGGYSEDPAIVAENVARFIDAGAAGINLEDGRDAPELHARKIEVVRNVAERAGVKLFINARTDVYLKRLVAPEAMLEETLRRGWKIKQAGADGLFVPLAIEPEAIKAIASEIDLPLNVMSWAGAPKAGALRELGVKRLSAGGAMAIAAWEALRAATVAFLADGDSDALRARAGAPVNYNDWFKS